MQTGQFLSTSILFVLSFIFPSPNKNRIFPNRDATHRVFVQRQSHKEVRDIPYGDAEGTYNLLDAWLPDERDSNTKVIVYIDGGSWVQGDKSEFPPAMVEELVDKRRYILVSLNYRLVKDGKNIFPAQIEDIQKALSFISKNAAKYHYNGDSFALIGASAGAHLALLYAYGYASLKQVKTVIDIFGPTDLTDESVRKSGLESNDIISNFLGTTDTSALIAKQASPYFHLTKSTGVPTIIFHGSADGLVNPSQSEKLYLKLQQLDIPAQIKIYPGEKHELRPPVAADVFANIIAWLGQYYS